MVRSDTRKYRIRRKKVSKKIHRGGGIVAERVASIERRNNPSYKFTQKAKKRKSSQKKSSTKRIFSTNLRPVVVEQAKLPEYKPPPEFSPEKSSTPRASLEKPLPVVNVPVETPRRPLVRGNKKNVIVTPILPEYTQALNAIEELDDYLALQLVEKQLSSKSSTKPLSPIKAEFVNKIQNPILSNNEVSDNIFNLIAKSVPAENREQAGNFAEIVRLMINKESASIKSASIKSAPLSVKKEKKVRKNIFRMWRGFIDRLSKVGKKGKSVKRSDALKRMASIRGLTNIGRVVENPIRSASLESKKSSGSPSRYGPSPVYASAKKKSNPEYANVNAFVEELIKPVEVKLTDEEIMERFMGLDPKWEAHKARVIQAKEEAAQLNRDIAENEKNILKREAEVIKLRQLTAVKKALRTQGEYIEINPGSQKKSPEGTRKSRRSLPESIRKERKEQVIREIEKAYEEYIKNLEKKI
jgi:hypothetical protein